MSEHVICAHLGGVKWSKGRVEFSSGGLCELLTCCDGKFANIFFLEETAGSFRIPDGAFGVEMRRESS
jgi:hypothetical protein